MLANFALTYKSSEKLDYILRKITRGPSLDVCSGLIVLFLNIHWVETLSNVIKNANILNHWHSG